MSLSVPFRFPTALAVAAALLLPGLLPAQEEKPKPKGWLRILPVGEAPPFRQEIRNGIRYELPAPEGSIPPLQVSVPGVGDREAAVLRLKLDTVSTPALVSAGPVPLKEADPDGPVPVEAWHGVKMPERPAAMALLWRDPREKSWAKARSLVLSDDTNSFPAGRVRVVNVSPFNVGVELQGKRVGLKPGQATLLGAPRTPLKQAALKVAVVDSKGKPMTVYNSAISQSATERTNVVVYRADGEKPRRPAKVLVRREKAALPPLPRGNQ